MDARILSLKPPRVPKKEPTLYHRHTFATVAGFATCRERGWPPHRRAGGRGPPPGANVSLSRGHVPPAGPERCRNVMRRFWIMGLAAIAGVLLFLAAVAGWHALTAGFRSVSCGTRIVPRCFGGVTDNDFQRPLEDAGFRCDIVHGTDSSIERCTDAAQWVDIQPMGQLVSYAVANAPQGAVPSSYRVLFETVARTPFPRDSALAERAQHWVDANLDGRDHDTNIADYSYTLSRGIGWPRLVVQA